MTDRKALLVTNDLFFRAKLGTLLEQLEEKDAAADSFKKGLLLAMRNND